MSRALMEGTDLSNFFNHYLPSTSGDPLPRLKGRTASFCTERSGHYDNFDQGITFFLVSDECPFRSAITLPALLLLFPPGPVSLCRKWNFFFSSSFSSPMRPVSAFVACSCGCCGHAISPCSHLFLFHAQPNMTWIQPPGYVHKMIHDTWQPIALNVSVTPSSASASAQISEDGQTVR